MRLCVLRVSYTYHGDESPLVAALIRKHCSTLRIIDKIAMDVAVDAITCELNARKLVLLDFDTTNHETMMPTLRARIIDSLANSGASIDKLVYWTEHGMAPSEIPFTRLLNNTRVSLFDLYRKLETGTSFLLKFLRDGIIRDPKSRIPVRSLIVIICSGINISIVNT